MGPNEWTDGPPDDREARADDPLTRELRAKWAEEDKARKAFFEKRDEQRGKFRRGGAGGEVRISWVVPLTVPWVSLPCEDFSSLDRGI